MPGTFSKTSRPLRPGAYFNFVAQTAPAVAPSIGSVLAIPFVHNWGPFKEPVLLTSWDQFVAIFGNDPTQPGYKAVKQAFQGEGLPGRGGAGAVYAYRFGDASAAKATLILQNTTPVAALTLTARYQGSRGNALRATVQASPTVANKQLVILEGSTVLETYDWPATDLAGLAAQINANSGFVTAAVTQDGVALGAVSAQPLVGGMDGATPIAGDYSAMLTAIETVRFGIFTTDLDAAASAPIVTSIKTWVDYHNIHGKRFEAVIGGPSDESATTANARSVTLNDPWFVHISGGHVVDDQLGALSPAQFAPRVAGALAQRGESAALTYARFTGVKLVNGIAISSIEGAFGAGTTVLTQDQHPTAPVRIEKGVTTYTGGDPAKPVLIYSNPKFVRTMQNFEMELTEWAEQQVIGQLPITERTRQLVVGEALARLNARVAQGVLQPGASVKLDTNPPPGATDEFIGLVIGMSFGRDIEQIFYTANIA